MLRITRISVHFFGVIWHVRLVILLMFVWLLVGAAAIAYFEEISFGEAIYFSFVTGLTIGYGDICRENRCGTFGSGSYRIHWRSFYGFGDCRSRGDNSKYLPAFRRF